MSVQISTPCLPTTSICEGDYGCGPDTHMAAIARIMPIFHGKPWDASTAYGALEVVEQPDGVMYITKCPTPAGTPLDNCTYWVVYNENWNVRLETVEKEIDVLQLEDKLNIRLSEPGYLGDSGTWTCDETDDWGVIAANPQNILIDGRALSTSWGRISEVNDQLAFEFAVMTDYTTLEPRITFYKLFILDNGRWICLNAELATQQGLTDLEETLVEADKEIKSDLEKEAAEREKADAELKEKIEAIKPQITGLFISASNADEGPEGYEFISDFTFDDFKANPALAAVKTVESSPDPLTQVVDVHEGDDGTKSISYWTHDKRMKTFTLEPGNRFWEYSTFKPVNEGVLRSKQFHALSNLARHDAVIWLHVYDKHYTAANYELVDGYVKRALFVDYPLDGGLTLFSLVYDNSTRAYKLYMIDPLQGGMQEVTESFEVYYR